MENGQAAARAGKWGLFVHCRCVFLLFMAGNRECPLVGSSPALMVDGYLAANSAENWYLGKNNKTKILKHRKNLAETRRAAIDLHFVPTNGGGGSGLQIVCYFSSQVC